MSYPSDVVTVVSFLSQYPDSLSWRGKNKPDPTTAVGQRLIADRMCDAKSKPISVSMPTTIPDEAVSVVLRAVFSRTEKESEYVKLVHSESMACENAVGELLERYLDEKLTALGWARCWGEVANKIDFIKKKPSGGYDLLQVKNRDNSENSSSSSVRDGTPIKKWFRSFSKKGGTNWAAFPDQVAKSHLSEEEFLRFITKTLR